MDTVGLSGQSVVVVLDRGLVKVSACMFMANRRPGHLVVPHCWLLAQIFIEGVAAVMGTQARIVQKLEQVLWSFQPPNTAVQIFETKNLVFVDQCNVCVASTNGKHRGLTNSAIPSSTFTWPHNSFEEVEAIVKRKE